jgi:hypothetical protein
MTPTLIDTIVAIMKGVDDRAHARIEALEARLAQLEPKPIVKLKGEWARGSYQPGEGALYGGRLWICTAGDRQRAIEGLRRVARGVEAHAVTLDEAIAKSARHLTEWSAEHEADLLKHLQAIGATDAELSAARERSRATLNDEIRTARHQITAVWFSDSPRIH